MNAVNATPEPCEALQLELESLTYAISHDLRAPLRAVSGFVGALEEDFGARLDDEGRRLLSVVSAEAARAMAMLDALLVLSRLHRQALVEETIDMTALARDVAAEVAPGNDGWFAIDDLPPMRGDRTLMRSLWANLLRNAVTATHGCAEPQISVSAHTLSARVVYVVRDNGVGFDMRYGDKLFKPFQKLHHADTFPGLGAGLATVASIATRHAGSVSADARVADGASFSVSFPSEAPYYERL